MCAAVTGLLALLAAACGVKESRVSTAWAAACPIQLETRADGPVHEWSDCTEETGIAACRRLVTPGSVTPDPRVRAIVGQGVEIAYGQRLEAGPGTGERARKQWLWAGIDGELRVRAVQMDSDEAACTYYVEELRDDGLRLSVRGDGRGPLAESPADGLVHVDREAEVRVLFRNENHEVSRWNGNLRRVAPGRRLERHDLTAAQGAAQESEQALAVVHDPKLDPDQLGVGAAAPLEVDGTLYFEVGDVGHRAILAWSSSEGVRAVRRYAVDEARAAGNLGSDGELLVWTEGEARGEDGSFGQTWIAAASVQQPQRVRRVAEDGSNRVGAAPFAVGCGWAGHRVPGGALLVDLESGETLRLYDGDELRWGNVLAISCDEVFVSYATPRAANPRGMDLARIPRAGLVLPRGAASERRRAEIWGLGS
jgi:hypothetical protein